MNYKSKYITLLVLFLLAIPTLVSAQDFTASTLDDYGNVTVMEVMGNYDAENPDGTVNDHPRQEIAKEFFSTHTDDYDFLVIFTNFDFLMPEAETLAFYLGVKNNTQGIGKELFDNSAFYGSDGRLQGFIDMGNTSELGLIPLDHAYEETLDILAHEMMHRWGAYVKFQEADGTISDALLHFDPAKHAAHWSYLLDSRGSVLYGNQWQDNGDGTFTSIGARKYYSPLDLYLMGVYDKSQVPPMLLIENPDIPPEKPPQVGITIEGTPRYITIGDIIAAEGERVPGPSEARKTFKTAFIFITQPNTFTTDELSEFYVAGIENIRDGWITRYSILTDGEGMMEVASTPIVDIPTNPGVTPPPVTPRTLPPDIDEGVAWLMGRQGMDGSWMDSPRTTQRDTAEAVLALKDFDAARNNYSGGLQWLGATDTRSTDYLSRKIEAVLNSEQDSVALLDTLLSGQNPDGGWGSRKNYMSNPLDTSFALKALAVMGYADSAVLSKAVDYLKSKQHADGGWGSNDGESAIQATANVLAAFNQYRVSYPLDNEIDSGIGWLLSRQNTDSGFGNSPSTVYDTAMAVLTLRGFDISEDVITNGLDYLLAQQSDDGSWQKSPYQTALAVHAVWKATINPDLSIRIGDITFAPPSVMRLPADMVVQAEIWNLGRTDVPQAKVVLYDGEIADGNRIGEQTFAVPGRSSVTAAFPVTITDGDEHRFHIAVDPDNLVRESNESNNTALNVLSPESTYDLEILTGDISVSQDPVDIFDDVTISAKITNRGTRDAFNVQVRYYLDNTDGPFDIATVTVDIPAGITIDNQVIWRSDQAGDSLPITVQVDAFDLFAELSEANNQASTSLTVNELIDPNLTLSYEDIMITPSPVTEGGSVMISALVRNEGFSPASGIQVDFYSGDPGAGGVLLGSRMIPSLNGGESSAVSVDWTNIVESGEKIVTVQADPGNLITEIREDDNDAFTTLSVLHIPTPPDLSVSTESMVFTPPAPTEGDTVSMIVNVRNDGESDVSNLLVTAYEGDAVIGSQSIALLQGNGEAWVAFTYDTTGMRGPHEITVVVDPDNTILEQREDNNRATRSFSVFGVADADLQVTDAYISPDGDHVKDATQFFFRLDGPQTVTIVVINETGETVRTFSGTEYENTTGGTVTWDGLDDLGRVVDDGEYTLQVLDENGVTLGSMQVLVDNNRVPLTGIEDLAVTGNSNLSCRLPEEILFETGTSWWEWSYNYSMWLQDESGILYTTDSSSDGFIPGIYRLSTDGSDRTLIMPYDWGGNGGDFFSWSSLMDLSSDGEKIAFTGETANLPASGGYQWISSDLWVIDSNGRNLTLADTRPYNNEEQRNDEYFNLLKWSPDNAYLLYDVSIRNTGNELWIVKPDGSGKTKIGSGYVRNSYWSPDSKKIAQLLVLPDSGGDPYKYDLKITVTDITTGNTTDVFSMNDVSYYDPLSITWLNDQKIILKAKKRNPATSSFFDRLWLVDTTGQAGHKLIWEYDADQWANDPWGSQIGIGDIYVFPDGHKFVFTIGLASSIGLFYREISIINAQGEEVMKSSTPSNYYRMLVNAEPVFSPDGNQVAFGEYFYTNLNRYYSGTRTLDIETKQVIDRAWTWVDYKFTPKQWLEDGNLILGRADPMKSGLDYMVIAFDPLTGSRKTLVSRPGWWSSSDVSVSPLGHYLTYNTEEDTTDVPGCTGRINNYGDGTTTMDTTWSLRLGSLENLTADLQVSTDGARVILQGIARDRNFERYKLEYADAKTPDTWNLIGPPSYVPVVNDVFARWIPPYEGTFYVRLTVRDKAGNVATDTKRVSWGIYSSITNFNKSVEIFSPNGDGVTDTVALHYRVLEPLHPEFAIYDGDGRLIRTFMNDHASPGEGAITWDGRDSSGRLVVDGSYTIRVMDYQFSVEVDNTPPDVHLALSPIQQTFVRVDLYENYHLSVDLSGHAVDDNLKYWMVEYGEGDNPEEWYEYKRGEDILVAKDDKGDPLLDPIEGDLIDQPGIEFLVGKRFRITSEDLAGNKSTWITDFLEEKLIFHEWYKEPTSISYYWQYLISELSPAAQQFFSYRSFNIIQGLIANYHAPTIAGATETIREPLTGVTLQYSPDGVTWYDEVTVHEPSNPLVEFEWDTGPIDPSEMSWVRVRAEDILGHEYLSNMVRVINDDVVKIGFGCSPENENVTLEILNGPAVSGDVRLLKFQIRSDGDSDYDTWTDFHEYPIPEGGVEEPLVSIRADLPHNLKDGASYRMRVQGTKETGEVIWNIDPLSFDYPLPPCPKDLKLYLEYDQAAGCNELSPGTVRLRSQVPLMISEGTLTYYLEDPDGSSSILNSLEFFSEDIKWYENQAYDPAWGWVTIMYPGVETTVDTSPFTEGGYPIRGVMEYRFPVGEETYGEGSWEYTEELVVDRELPDARITYPGESQLVCPVRNPDPQGGAYGVPVEGTAADNHLVKRHSLSPGDIKGVGTVEGRLGFVDVADLTSVSNLLELKVVDVAGNVSCDAVEFLIDSIIEITGLASDNETFSPNGDGVLDDVTISYDIGEDATVDVEVFKLNKTSWGVEVPDTVPLRTILTGGQHPGGMGSATWDGRDDSGTVVPDGKYGIAVSAADSCGTSSRRWVAVRVDNTTADETPPEVRLDSPKDGEIYGSDKNTVNVSGAIVEDNLATFSLRYGSGENPVQWNELLTGSTLPVDSQLLQWNVGGLSDGSYTLSLYARDTSGLEGEALVTIHVDNTPPVIGFTSPAEGGYVKEGGEITGTAHDQNLLQYTVAFSTGDCLNAFKWETIKQAGISVQAGILAEWRNLPPDGDYCLNLTAVDMAGNDAASTINVKIDTRPPGAPVLSGDIENQTDARLTWTQAAEPDVAGYDLYRDDQKVNTALLTGTTYLDQASGEGLFAYKVRTVDLAGWESGPSNEIRLAVDFTGPDARISLPRDGSGVGNLVEIRGTAFSADDFRQYRVYTGRGSAPTTWNLIRTSPLPVLASTLAQWDTTGLGEGEVYSLRLEAEDISGNINTHQVAATIDNTAPAPPVLVSATPVDADVTLEWQANSEADLAGYLLYGNDRLVNGNNSGSVSGGLTPYLLPGATYLDGGLPDGRFSYYLAAMDKTGNLSDPSNIIEVVIDTHPPQAEIVDPLDGLVFEKETPLKAESPDRDIASIQFQYRPAAGSVWSDIGVGVTTQPYITGLDPGGLGWTFGDYNLRAVATDLGGKTGLSPAEILVTYTDLTAPDVPAGLTTAVAGGNVTLTWRANTGGDLDGYNIYRMSGGAKTQLNTSIVKGTTYQDIALPDGTYAYEITAVDTYGNESSPSDSVSVRVYAPLLEQPYTPAGESVIHISGSNAEPAAAVEIFIDTGSGTVSQGTTTSDAEGNFLYQATLTLGENRITASVTDSAGNRSKVSEALVVVYNEPPSAPARLTASVQDYQVGLTWNPSPESDLLGYNLYRDNEKVNAPGAVTSGVATASSYSSISSRAFDADPSTYWFSYVYNTSSPAWWEINLPSPELINRAEIQWGSYQDSQGNETFYAGKDYEIQVWSGYAWITQVKVTGNNAKENTFDFKPSYRTDRIRIFITAANDTNNVRISEITIFKDNLITQPSYDDMNLNDGEYNYQVTAVDYYGFESLTSEGVNTIVGDIIPPSAPQGLTATSSGSDIILVWSENAEQDLAGYNLSRNTPEGWLQVNTSLIAASTYTDTGLPNGTYAYRTTAVDTVGNESLPSNEVSAIVVIAPPPPPENLSATPLLEGEALRLSWGYTGVPVAGYDLYRCAASGGPYVKVNEGLITNNEVVDPELTNGIAYYYVVVAVGALGNESATSNEAMGIPTDTVPPPSTETFLSSITGGGCVVRYTDRVDISGITEPGGTVELFGAGAFSSSSIGSITASTTALEGDVSQSLTTDYDGSSGASLSPDGGTLAYSYQGLMWLLDIATGSTEETGQDGRDPLWSPDGNRFAFRSNNRISVYNIATDSSTPLTGDANVYEVYSSWSSDGTKVAFSSNRGGSYDVWIKDLLSGSLTQVTGNVYPSNPGLSPDGKRLAYFVSSSLYVADLLNGETIEVATQTDRVSLDWSPDSRGLAFVSYRNGDDDLFVYDLTTQGQTQLTDTSQSEYYPAWSPDGQDIAFAKREDDGSWSVWVISAQIQGEDRLIEENLNDLRHLFRAASGRLAYMEQNILTLVDFGGQYSFEDIKLAAGENRFHVIATDASGNTGPASEDICIIYDTSLFPDPEVMADDISLYPHSPIDGDEVTITTRVNNRGQVEAQNVEVDIYLWDAKGALELVTSGTVPYMAPNSEETIHVSWDTTGKTGTNTIIVVVDPEDKITELTETNNFAATDFYVAAEEGISMTTTLDSTQYGSSQDVNIDITLRNSGFERDVVVEVWIEDGDGNPVLLLDTIGTSLPYASEEVYSLVWNTGTTYAGPYRVHTALRNLPDVIAENIAPFTILPDIDIATTVVTDRASYEPNEDVVIDFDITNNGQNYVIPALDVKVRIVDSGNVELFSEDKATSNLLPGVTTAFSTTWNTGMNPPGEYSAVVEVYSDGAMLFRGSAPFRIDAVAIIAGEVTVTPPVVILGNLVQADYTIRNNGNVDAVGLVVEVVVKDSETQAVMATHEETVDLAMNSSMSGLFAFSTHGYLLKTYSVLLQGNPENLTSESFTVRDGLPPVVSILSPVSGSSVSGAMGIAALASDDASGVDRVEYQVNNDGIWTPLPLTDVSKGIYGTTWTPSESDAGTHTIRFRATDVSGNLSEPVSTTVTVVFNHAPEAVAGPDQNVATGSVVTLDGSGSSDPDGDLIIFLWYFVTVPGGSSVNDALLSDPAGIQPTFTTDIDGLYLLELVVNDGQMESGPATVVIFAETPNVPPNADAGTDQSVSVVAPVSLNGDGSNDPDNGPEPLTYFWTFTGKPVESLLSDADINNADTPYPLFIPDVAGTYELNLEVSDGEASDHAHVLVVATIPNVPPNANAGDDIMMALGEPAVLDGSTSYDPDGGPQPLTYQWHFVSVPSGSGMDDTHLSGVDTASPGFTPDVEGSYLLGLMVSDGEEAATDNLVVTVIAACHVLGDFNDDCRIDVYDYLIFRTTLGKCDGDFAFIAEADYDGDGCISYADYRIWYGHYKYYVYF